MTRNLFAYRSRRDMLQQAGKLGMVIGTGAGAVTALSAFSQGHASSNTQDYGSISAAPLSDGRLQIFATRTDGKLYTRWKLTTDPNAGWSDWTQFSIPTSFGLATAVAPLPDGRLQLWIIDGFGQLLSCRKQTTDSNSGWTNWDAFPGDPRGSIDVTAAPLPDRRLHLWVINGLGQLHTCWQLTTDPNSSWSAWFTF